MGTHGSKDAKGNDPEDKDNDVPDPDDGEAKNEGDHVEESCEGGDSAHGDHVSLITSVSSGSR